MEKYLRTNYCGDLSLSNVGETVTVIGWVQKRRNLGNLLFIDLRDRKGIIQICVNNEVEIPDIRNEYIIQVTGVVTKKDNPNPNLKTGEIEINANKITLINTSEQPPISTGEDSNANEDIRLKYRYLDLRRKSMQDRFLIRAKIVKSVHEYLDENDFVEIETPYLAPSTPEGARDYLVPSRLHKGCFYALPQSPQLYKQMLMISGFERYYQIARCFRDEDLRADRQPDFTQIDIETSFLNQEEILTLMEGLIKKIFKDTINFDVKLPLRQMEYDEAVDVYGSDKPDTRFDMKIIDLTSLLKNSNFESYKQSKYIRGILVENYSHIATRKKQDELNLLASKFSLKGFGCYKFINGTLEGSLVKFLSNEIITELINLFNPKEGDVIFVANGAIRKNVAFGLGALRTKLAKELNLIKPNTYDLLWVVHFPLFEKSEETNEITPCHHPFTRPCDEDLDKLMTKPYEVYSYAYDIVINGYEAGGGSLRIYDQKVQKEIFNVLGFTEEDIDKKFGFFVEALKYGTPPHGGIAFGLDRLTMILSGTDNIRDVIAFPKNLNGICPVTNAPLEVDDEQLKAVGIKIREDEN